MKCTKRKVDYIYNSLSWGPWKHEGNRHVGMIRCFENFDTQRPLKLLWFLWTTLPLNFNMRVHTRSVLLVGILCSVLFIFSLELWPPLFSDDETEVNSNSPLVDSDVSEIRLKIGSPVPDERDSKCLMHNCFDIFRCKVNENKLISVYVYPDTRFLDEEGKTINKPMSQEFYELLTTIVESKYYTPDIEKACIIVPSIDTLNQKGLDLRWTARSLAELPR